MSPRILLFEDGVPHADSVFAALAARANPSEKITVVWFRRGFNPPVGREIYPVEVAAGYGPKVIEIGNSVGPRADGVLTWWQSQFDAAILDIYLERTIRPVGYLYAEWLERAAFTGPVAIVSGRARDTDHFKLNALRLHKQDGDWAERAVAHVLTGAEFSPTGARTRRLHSKVNYLGRDPDTFLQSFYSNDKDKEVFERQRWLCAYFGNNKVLAKHLSAFFELPFHKGEETHPIENLRDVLVEAEDRGGRPPKVVWIDCADRDNCLSDDLVEELAEAFRERAWKPIGVFLADKDGLVGNRQRLFRCNAFCVTHQDLGQTPGPGLWAGKAVERLAVAYTHFKEAAQDHGRNIASLLPTHSKDKSGQRLKSRGPWPDTVLGAGLGVVEALLPPFMMARSMARLVGSKQFPSSLAAWTSRNARANLNTQFANVAAEILLRLREADLVSDMQMGLYVRSPNPAEQG